MDAPLTQAGEPFPRETDDAMVALYDELRSLTHAWLRRRRPGRGLQTTEVVHEAYLKLWKSGKEGWESRGHFWGTAAKALKQVLFNAVRDDQVRGNALSYDESAFPAADPALATREVTLLVRFGDDEVPIDVLHLVKHLADLEAIDTRKADVVTCKFFAGMTHDQIARYLGVTTRTIERDWEFAKAWLRQRMVPAGDHHGS